MSYRAFKRLLGETSLERKCRFLMGTGSLVLITASFWFYARQTERIAYEIATGELVALAPAPPLARVLATVRRRDKPPTPGLAAMLAALDAFARRNGAAR